MKCSARCCGVVRVDNLDQAIELVNAHEYGNGAALFSRDGEASRHFSGQVRVGMVGINVALPVPIASQCFGGWEAFAVRRPVCIRTGCDPFLYPAQDHDPALAAAQGRRPRWAAVLVSVFGFLKRATGPFDGVIDTVREALRLDRRRRHIT